MFELTRHIESLLLRNDCVIVPHLGGFVTSFRPARWIREENLFLPPTRSVGFNSHLTINDGLLTQSYMQAADISYPDAQRLVERDVEHVKDILLREGEFTFDGIGKLLQRLDGHYDFIPIEAGVISPELYGLDAVSVPLVHRADERAPQKAEHGRRDCTTSPAHAGLQGQPSAVWAVPPCTSQPSQPSRYCSTSHGLRPCSSRRPMRAKKPTWRAVLFSAMSAPRVRRRGKQLH